MIAKKKSSIPLLTVLMPVYNAEKFLAESINSILSQTYSDFELLILDDASTDNSLKIIRTHAKEDKRIKILINKTNQGEAKCRNRLLKTSKTEFIAWMDADDISLEDRLQKQMDFLKQNPNIDAVGVQYSAFGSSGNLSADFTSGCSLSDIEIKTNFIFGYDFFFPSSLMRIKKIKLHHLFFDINYKLSTGVDQQYIIDCFPFMKFANLDRVLYQYRQHAHQIMKVNQKQILDNSNVITRKHLLKFNIKADIETIHFFLQWIDKGLVKQKFSEIVKVFDIIFIIKKKFDFQKFQKVLLLLSQLTAIKDFYNYARIEKILFIPHCLNLWLYFCQNKFLKNNKKKNMEFFEDIFHRYPVTTDPFNLKQIFESYRKAGLVGFLDNFKPLLTVLMPVYNAEKFLEDSIGSILNQTYSNFELLILDDASTDNSLKIIRAHAKEDKRIKILVNKTNQKQAKCRNRLLKTTKTEFIAWMDADDISLVHRLQTQMDFLKQNSNIDAVGIQYSTFCSSCNQAAAFTSHFSLSDIEIKTNFIFGYDFLFGGHGLL